MKVVGKKTWIRLAPGNRFVLHFVIDLGSILARGVFFYFKSFSSLVFSHSLFSIDVN